PASTSQGGSSTTCSASRGAPRPRRPRPNRSWPEVSSAPPAGDLLQSMLGIPSLSGEEDRLAEWLLKRLGELEFQSERDQAGNVTAAWGSGDREVVLLGHIDTVPGLIPVRVEGGRLHGRGAVDAKGPLAAAIAAVARQPRQGRLRYTVIGAVEEEGSSKGAYHLLAAGRRPPAHPPGL